MEGLLLLILFGLFAAVIAVMYAKTMFDLGIILVIFGMLFGWPFSAIGACLVACHFYKNFPA